MPGPWSSAHDSSDGRSSVMSTDAPYPAIAQRTRPPAGSLDVRTESLLGDGLQRFGERRRRTAAATGLRHHHLRHVALDTDLARHERLHTGLLVARNEHGLGGVH